VSGIFLASVGASYKAAPPTIGQAYGGGYYAGTFTDAGVLYYLIVAPKASGESTSKQWKTSRTADTGASSETNGPLNTSNTNDTSHPAAYFCKGLTIGGFSDWYLPARNELLVMFNLGPEVAPVAAFQTGGSEAFSIGTARYWSSTEYGLVTLATAIDMSNQYRQDFYKDESRYVRAMRRVPA
jgi:hypothetical protein